MAASVRAASPFHKKMRFVLPLLLCLAFAQAQPQMLAPGLSVEEKRIDAGGKGPFKLWLLRYDTKSPSLNLLPVHANDRAMGNESIPQMAARYGALAAVNGGYFAFGTYAGNSKNNFVLNGRIFGTWRDRSALLLCAESKDHVERPAIALTHFTGWVYANKESIALDGVNREREASDLVLFTGDLGPSTLTRGGFEVLLDAKGKVLSTSTAGNSAIPPGGSVLSAAGKPQAWLERHSQPGIVLRVEAKVGQPACDASDVIGAGPRIVHDGKVDNSEWSGFAHAKPRHPRTAAAILSDGTLLLAVVDGRQKASVGMTLEELSNTLIELGAREAVNLDGGGSSTFYAAGRVWNQPSDGRPRPVSDGLLVFHFPDWASLGSWLEASSLFSASEKAPLLSEVSRPSPNRRKLLSLIPLNPVNPNPARILREAITMMPRAK